MASERTILVLEGKLRETIGAQWEKLARKYISEVVREVRQRNFVEAEKVITSLSTKDIAAKIVDEAVSVTLGAFIYGASNSSGDAKKSQVVKSKLKPDLLDNSIKQLQVMLEQMADPIVKTAQFLLAEEVSYLRGQELTTLQKAQKVKNFEDVFRGKVYAVGESAIDLVSSLHIVRLASFGFLVEAELDGVTAYQIRAVIDPRTSEVCRALNGRVLPVDSARSRVELALSTDDPQQLRSLSPWPRSTPEGIAALRSMSAAELVGAGYQFPPFHPRCRTILVPAQRDPTLVPVNARPKVIPAKEPEYVPGLDDVQAVAEDLSAASIAAAFNESLQSALDGVPNDEISKPFEDL